MDSSTSSTPVSTSETGGTHSTSHAAEAAVTRQASTEDAYLQRALGFARRTSLELSIRDPAPPVVAAHALELREEWAKATWRQMKSALLFRYRAMGSPEAFEACDMLLSADQGICPKTSSRTSGRRAKHYGAEQFQVVLAEIQSSNSQYSALLATWLLLGHEVGLRPHEWGQAEVIFEISELNGDGRPESGEAIPYLRIQNAKCTNGRAHGDFRHLDLTALDPGLVQAIGDFARLMSEATARGEYSQLYSSCAKLLYRVNRRVHSGNEQRWIQLYSPRHRFSSEAKKALDEAGVAALMGHRTTATAGRHYGRRIAATGTLGPRPIAMEVARVRKSRVNQASNAARSQVPAFGNLRPAQNFPDS